METDDFKLSVIWRNFIGFKLVIFEQFLNPGLVECACSVTKKQLPKTNGPLIQSENTQIRSLLSDAIKSVFYLKITNVPPDGAQRYVCTPGAAMREDGGQQMVVSPLSPAQVSAPPPTYVGRTLQDVGWGFGVTPVPYRVSPEPLEEHLK